MAAVDEVTEHLYLAMCFAVIAITIILLAMASNNYTCCSSSTVGWLDIAGQVAKCKLKKKICQIYLASYVVTGISH